MKKHLFLVAIIGFGVATLCSCGNSNSGNSNKEEMDMDYRDAIKALDFETARDIMNTYHERYIEELSKSASRDKNKEERKKAQGMYYSAFDHIYKAEIQYLLSELNGDECKDKITFLLEGIPVEGEKFPQGLYSYRIVTRDEYDDGLPLDAYIVWTQHFNRLCDTILSLAINRRNQDLDTMILLKYVDTVEVTIGDGPGIVVDGVKVDGDHGYIKYTSADRDAARKKYDEAVRIGAFK